MEQERRRRLPVIRGFVGMENFLHASYAGAAVEVTPEPASASAAEVVLVPLSGTDTERVIMAIESLGDTEEGQTLMSWLLQGKADTEVSEPPAYAELWRAIAGIEDEDARRSITSYIVALERRLHLASARAALFREFLSDYAALLRSLSGNEGALKRLERALEPGLEAVFLEADDAKDQVIRDQQREIDRLRDQLNGTAV